MKNFERLAKKIRIVVLASLLAIDTFVFSGGSVNAEASEIATIDDITPHFNQTLDMIQQETERLKSFTPEDTNISKIDGVQKPSAGSSENTDDDEGAAIKDVDVPDFNLFTDISPVKYYYVPIKWSVTNRVATGVTRTKFCPDNYCTRAQVVTMLYALYGNDEIAPPANFSDVSASDYYYEAVNWAVSKEITMGTTSTTFSPKKYCTRAEAVTFLYKAVSDGTVSTSASRFSDVPNGSYYYYPVSWAVDKNVTAGTSTTTFSPKQLCSRGQIVTFLYHAVNG